MYKSLRAACVGLSIFLHASIVLLAIFWAQIAPMPEVPVPLYIVDLVTLPGAPGKIGPPLDPGPGPVTPPKPEPEPPGPAPSVPQQPEPAAKPPAPEPAPIKPTPPPPKPEPAKPEPKPVPKPVEPPPPPKGKDIAAKKEDNLKKPEPKPKEPEKKAEPQPPQKPDPNAKNKNYVKTDPEPKKKNQPPTKEQILAQALESAQKDSAKEDKAGRDALSKELAALRGAVAREPGSGGSGSGAGTGAGAGAGGENGGGGAGGPDVAYLRAISQMIKEHWSFPKLGGRQTLIAQVEITLDQNGGIQEYRLANSSGKEDYDASTLKAIVETQQEERLPPPPKGLRVIRINFNSQELQ